MWNNCHLNYVQRSGKCLSEAYLGAYKAFQTKEIELSGVKSNLDQIEENIKQLGEFMNRHRSNNNTSDRIDISKSAADIIGSTLKELAIVFSSLHYFQGQNVGNCKTYHIFTPGPKINYWGL